MSLLGGGSIGIAVVLAVFLSNIPEALSASTGMRHDGRSVRYVLGLWTAVVLASVAALLWAMASWVAPVSRPCPSSRPSRPAPS